ncbi:MAG: hypothetical protein J7F05_04340 [Trichodesmium erythraeum GBRTRLIN201]|uniref:group II intron maturase-specific domain-containing protein n=1 Tax=Trichodesmium erythraeum TaxID=1206 RepID=UPI0009D64FD8|nr:hypothetical protein [Trichodesmium erythraeum GBRTRLIN201]
MYYRKLADICDSHKYAPVSALVTKLNPLIRAAANYYSALVSQEIYTKVDYLL